AQSDALRLHQHGMFGNQVVRRALHQEGHQGLRQAPGKLLSPHIAGLLLDLGNADLLGPHFGHDVLPQIVLEAKGVSQDAARDQHDHHGSTDHYQETAQNNFLDRTGGLQKTNHLSCSYSRLVSWKLNYKRPLGHSPWLRCVSRAAPAHAAPVEQVDSKAHNRRSASTSSPEAVSEPSCVRPVTTDF